MATVPRITLYRRR